MSKIKDVRLVQTCGACPEQYDAFIEDQYVGHLHLRHGHFTVRYTSGDVIYEADPKGDGIFEYEERPYYLTNAKIALLARHFEVKMDVHDGPSEINLVQTCGACPEQYDAFMDGEKIGYLRLRHGFFSVEYTPDEETVYTANPKGDGCFEPDEQEAYLTEAKQALFERHMLTKIGLAMQASGSQFR